MVKLVRESASHARGDGVLTYFALACVWTWVLALPAALAWIEHNPPSPLAIACAGFSAFGPLVGAIVVARPRGRLREVFSRFRTNPGWVILALITPALIHTVARLVHVAFGGSVEQWWVPPVQPTQLAALFVFPFSEEFGWRGFAHAPMAQRFGPVVGSLLVGLGWALWHLAYSITPEAAGFDLELFALTMIELPLISLPIAWMFERSGRSMAVAIAFHAGGHLDHIERTAHGTLGLHGAHIVLLLILAALAGRSLARGSRPSHATGRVDRAASYTACDISKGDP